MAQRNLKTAPATDLPMAEEHDPRVVGANQIEATNEATANAIEAAGVAMIDDLTRPLTGKLIEARMAAALGYLFGAAYEPELRQIADNGKAYPLDVDLPPEVAATGEIREVNRFGFIASGMLNGVCWGLDNQLRKMADRLRDEARKTRAMEAKAAAQGEDASGLLARAADFADRLRLDQALTQKLYAEACAAHLSLLGRPYQSIAEREELARRNARETARPVAPARRFD